MMAATSENPKGTGRSSSSSGPSSGSLEVIEKPRTTTVSVDDSETWVEAKRFTVYKVVVKVQGRSYFIFRRYAPLHYSHSSPVCKRGEGVVGFSPPFQACKTFLLLLHRYNEFSELHDKLKRKFPDANSLKLPGKRFLGNNFDPEFIKSRKERLHEFVLKMTKVSSL